MRNINLYIAILSAFILYSCTSSEDELIMNDFSNNQSIISRAESNDTDVQFNEVVKYIKFDVDSFIIDRSLEEVIEAGVSESVYNQLVDKLKVHTEEARNIIKKGGTYQFVNLYANDSKFNTPTLKATSSYGGILEYPGENKVLVGELNSFPPILGVHFRCDARILDKETKAEVDIAVNVWYECKIECVNGSVGSKVRALVGTPRIDLGIVELPGEMDSPAQPPYRISFTAELLDDTQYIFEKATCNWSASTVV